MLNLEDHEDERPVFFDCCPLPLFLVDWVTSIDHFSTTCIRINVGKKRPVSWICWLPDWSSRDAGASVFFCQVDNYCCKKAFVTSLDIRLCCRNNIYTLLLFYCRVVVWKSWVEFELNCSFIMPVSFGCKNLLWLLWKNESYRALE